MSSQERSDDSDGSGYGSTKQDSIFDEAKQTSSGGDDAREETVPSDKEREEDADGDWPG